MAASAADLERRKQLRIRIRPDLNIEPQRYEGKIFFILKDPISLRYYRLQDKERLLLKYMDGKHTLEDAQKAYEKEYRPERMDLEHLEAFAQQLLTTGLAISESPRAGHLLYERRGKRKRDEWIRVLTNLLYIKIPIFDPERLLTRMLNYTGWIFSWWFATLSVGVMLGAIGLVLTHFETFRAKLPDYHEFFSFKQVIYFYVALTVVKIIHEFGHGLSCKRYGGEVHEMGLLFMVFSPAMYCNVSDAWLLPNKWHRIIISGAGIYVEMVIAAIATFVWWYTPGKPGINNVALCLMVLCSVSTVVFNANPLMRFDGYYVLADWLEIPNLREKSNRYIQNLFLEYGLGIEVPPEDYMDLWRRILFLVYAIASFVYLWIVTFSILLLFHNMLKPYKLEVVGNLLTIAVIAQMIIPSLYRMGKNINRRGRLPDMKRLNVVITTSILIALLLFLCLVPIPISRIRGLALVQAHPDVFAQVTLKRTAYLKELKVSPGDTVTKGSELAVFRDPDLEDRLAQAKSDLETSKVQLRLLEEQKDATTEPAERRKLDEDIARVTGRKGTADATVKSLIEIQENELKLLAPRDGVIGQCPKLEDVGKLFEGAREQPQAPPVFTVFTRGRIRLTLPLATTEFNQLRSNLQALARDRKNKGKELDVTLRVHGLDSSTWKGRIARLDESECKAIPPALSSRAGGTVDVKAAGGKGGALVPQAQHYLVYIDVIDPDPSITVGTMAQVKIYCRNETVLDWAWRKINNTLNLQLL